MFRALELITLDLLCLYSNAVPQYLEQSIRNAQPNVTRMGPMWADQIFQLIQQGPSEIFYHLDSVLFADAKLQEKVMPYTCRHRLVPRHEGQLLSTVHGVSLKSFLRPCVTARCWPVCTSKTVIVYLHRLALVQPLCLHLIKALFFYVWGAWDSVDVDWIEHVITITALTYVKADLAISIHSSPSTSFLCLFLRLSLLKSDQ